MLFVVFEISNGLMYATDFETGKAQYTFILGGADVEVIPKPENVEWLFMKRREYNSRFIRKYRGF